MVLGFKIGMLRPEDFPEDPEDKPTPHEDGDADEDEDGDEDDSEARDDSVQFGFDTSPIIDTVRAPQPRMLTRLNSQYWGTLGLGLTIEGFMCKTY